MKPFQPRCPGAQIERKWPAAQNYFRFSQEAITFLVGPRAHGAWRQVPRRGKGRPSLANFAVIPAPGVGQLNRGIDCLNLRSIFGTDALNTQHVGPLHGYSPDRWRALFCASAGPSRYTGPAFRFGPGGSNLPASARYRRQPGSSQARPAPPAPGVSTFNARGDGVEQAHVAGWPSRGRSGQGGVIAGGDGDGFQARGKDPVDMV